MIWLSEEEWAKAKHRRDVIGPLASLKVVGMTTAKEAARELGINVRQVYTLICQYRSGTGLVTDLACFRKNGGKGKSRISPEVELIIADVIENLYLTRQRRSQAAVRQEIVMRCRQGGHQPPSYNTIALRISKLDPLVVARKRHGVEETRRLQPAAGEMPPPSGPLELVQIDHTKMDVIVVDEVGREPIGRPSLTLAIDIFTRCIVGMLLTLEAPSATSVGLCLVNIVTDKRVWLERHKLDMEMWPMYGKPQKIHTDNGAEFKSEALKRGCEQHKIDIDYRPKGQPHFGGIIERVIGTAMKKAHGVPGTTFSSIEERGSYKSEERAVLTLAELEKWLILAIGTYHASVHSFLSQTPAAVWKKSIEFHPVANVADKTAFLVDFLPIVRRTIRRDGFEIDHICYYGDALKPWIARRDSLEKFIIRRDPRDLSRVWVLDPDSKLYFEIPYRCQSRTPVTLWEHRRALESLRKQGRGQVDETALFSMIEAMREITDVAAKERKRARRDKSRRSHLVNSEVATYLSVPADSDGVAKKVLPFGIDESTGIDVDIAIPTDVVLERPVVKPFEVEEWRNYD